MGQQQPVRFAVARAAGDDPWATAAERAPRLLGRLIEPLQGVVATPTLRLVDNHTGTDLLLPAGPIEGDALLSAIDLLTSAEDGV